MRRPRRGWQHSRLTFNLPHSKTLKFVLDQLLVRYGLVRGQYEENQAASSGDTDHLRDNITWAQVSAWLYTTSADGATVAAATVKLHLFTTTLAVLGSLNDTWEINQLDASTL